MLHSSDLSSAGLVGQQPRARGVLRVSSKLRQGRSVLEDLHQAGSMKAVFPRGAAGAFEAVMVNTAGGITGGDRFKTGVVAGSGTQVTITTQAAERAYRSQADEVGKVDAELSVKPGARLSWLPQETILFEGARFARRMSIDVARDAQLLFVEPLVFGRTACGEHLRDVTFSDRIDITQDGRPVFGDAVHLAGDVSDQMLRRGGGAGALASVVYMAPDAEACLGDVRRLLPRLGGASLLARDLLHVRLLAEDSFVLRQTLMPVLERLSSGPLPRVWRI